MLDTGGPLAGLAERFAAVAAEEAEALAVADRAEGKDELRWDAVERDASAGSPAG